MKHVISELWSRRTLTQTTVEKSRRLTTVSALRFSLSIHPLPSTIHTHAHTRDDIIWCRALVTTIVYLNGNTIIILSRRECRALCIRTETKYYIITYIYYTRISTAMFSTKGLLWRHLDAVCVCVGTQFFTAVKVMARIAYNIMVFCNGAAPGRWLREEGGNRINHKVYFAQHLYPHPTRTHTNTRTHSVIFTCKKKNVTTRFI